MHTVTSSEQNFQAQLNALTTELYQFVGSVQRPRLKDQDWIESVRTRCTELAQQASSAKAAATTLKDAMGARMATAREAAVARRTRLSDALDRMSSTLSAVAQEMSESQRMERWREYRVRLSEAYEEVALSVKSMRHPLSRRRAGIRHLKPINYHRNVFHAGMGLGALALYEFVVDWNGAMLILAAFSALAITLESTRKIWPRWNLALCGSIVFRHIIRPREWNRFNSASIFILTLTGVVLLAPMEAVVVGLMVLSLGDPAASIFGKRWGTKKLWKEKSWAGSGALFLVSMSAIMTYYTAKGMPGGVLFCLAVAVTAGAVGTATELFSERIDDNFTVLAMTTAVVSLFFI
jgi:dolichol kinase